MSVLQNLFILSLAQAHLVHLVVNSSLSLKIRGKARLPKLMDELLSCPVCVGFWIAIALSLGHPITALAVGFLGSALYEAKEKFLPCKQCKNDVKVSEWKIS